MSRFPLPAVLALISIAGPAWAADAPIALDKWGRHETSVEARLVGAAGEANARWAPRIRPIFQVKGPQTDDLVLVQHYDGGKPWGAPQKCKLDDDNLIARSGKDYHLVVATCDGPDEMGVKKAGKFSVKIGYRRTSDGVDFPDLATLSYEVKEAPYAIGSASKKLWYVDHDFRLGEAWSYRTSEGELQLWSWFKYRDEGVVTGAKLRCKNGDKSVAMFNGPRREHVAVESYPAPGKQELTTWALFYFFVAGDDAKGLLATPGTWTCNLTQNGELARELSFQVDGGAIQPAPCQGNGPDQVRVVEDEQMIKLVMKSSQDLKHDAAAWTKAPLYGRKLAAGCPL